MQKRLILVKHSLPQIMENLPARASELSEEGRIRSQQFAERWNPFQPEYIAFSVEPNVIETAEIIAARRTLQFHIPDGLHEPGRSKTPLLAKYGFQAVMYELFEKRETLVFGSEITDEAYARFDEAPRPALDCHPDETVVTVAQDTVISLSLSRLTRISDWSLWNELGLPSHVVIDVQFRRVVTRENIL